MKSKKLSESVANKTQGTKLEKAERPENSRPPEQAKYKARSGWGGMDVYAYGVKGMMDEAKTQKGSETGFLGKEKVMINPKDCCDGQMLHKKKK
jgi:hypothetical protein